MMDARLKDWKLAVERLWSAPAFNYHDAARLTAEIARAGEDAILQQQAAQALSSLRAACARTADRRTKDVAQRRFGAVRDCLYALTGPRFGKRANAEGMPTPGEQYRRLLGLPIGRRLFGPEIN